MKKFILNAAVSTSLAFLAAGSCVAAVVGPGDTAINAQDTAADLLVVDLTHPLNLAAGNHVVSLFSYQFAGGGSGGTITPILLSGNGINAFTSLAVGSTVTFVGATPFISTAFGGSSTFTLAAPTTVYAGLFWDGTTGVNLMPVGADFLVGNSYIRYSGANAPVVGAAVSGGGSGTFTRTYDFSITVDPTTPTAVPEPDTLMLFALGLTGIGLARRARKS